MVGAIEINEKPVASTFIMYIFKNTGYVVRVEATDFHDARLESHAALPEYTIY